MAKLDEFRSQLACVILYSRVSTLCCYYLCCPQKSLVVVFFY